mgnify:FL=1
MDVAMNKRDGFRRGNRDPIHAPQGCYPCKGDDDWITISITSDEEWINFTNALGNPEWNTDSRFATNDSRIKSHDTLDEYIGAWTSERDKMEIMQLLQNAGVPAGAVLKSKEVLLNEHYRARNYWELGMHPAETNIGGRGT